MTIDYLPTAEKQNGAGFLPRRFLLAVMYER